MTVVDTATPADARRLAARRRESLQFGYVPPAELTIDPSLKLHRIDESDTDLDPITYEVIRSKLFNLNLDHGATISRTSGSPIMEAGDFNVTLTTEDGEGLAYGPFLIVFAGYADLAIKWTLEFRSTNPGITDGDVFIHDDPWVATNHANDVCMYAPLFWEGELFAWLYSCAHHRDVGGPMPGSMNPNAMSAFEEPSLFPPTKLVEQGYLRDDILEVFTRRSRLSEISALEVKSQLAGITFARERLREIIERYGATVVKKAMKKRIADSAAVVGERLARLPDGIWHDETYVAGATATDVSPRKVGLSFEKRGDRLRVTNEGTDDPAGCLNQTSPGFRGSVLSPMFDAFAWDLDLCGAGILRQLDFDIEPGKINSATYPTAAGSSIGMCLVLTQSRVLNAKMCSADDLLSHHAMGVGNTHTAAGLIVTGIDQYKQPFAGVVLDGNEGGSPGIVDRDGFDHSGVSYMSHIPDVEEMERSYPLLCLYRRSLRESGSPGTFRGGACISTAFVGHNGTDVNCLRIGVITSMTLGKSVDGGWPSTGGLQRYSADSEVRDWLGSGRIPNSAAEIESLAPNLVITQKQMSPFTDTSIFQVISEPGGAFGDPIRRAPESVAADVGTGHTLPADAARIYGVVLADSPTGFDEPATRQRRADMIGARLAESREPREPCDGRTDIGPENVRVVASVALTAERGHLACVHCGEHLSDANGNFRLGCKELEQTLPELSPLFEDPEPEIHAKMVFRQYLCPSCGLAVDSDICKPDDYPYALFTLIQDEAA
jgi:N-methylhydantoinase B